MKKKNTDKQIEYFPIQFSKTIIWLGVAAILFCLVGIVVSVWRILSFGLPEFMDWLTSPFLIAICAFGIVVIISIFTKSQLYIEGTILYSQYGIIKSSFNIMEITSIIQDTDEKKLTVYFGESFMNITTSPVWFEKFVRALLDVNSDIKYSFTLTDKTSE
jgi:hypothetical protein